MLIVDGILVSQELIDDNFCCDITKCLGCCCVEGDVGAPIDPSEVSDLEDNYPIFKKYLSQEAIDIIENQGTFDYDMEGSFVTPLLANEACVYTYFENGIAKCAIEKAFLNHEIDFQKPISCHLYPIRIKQLPDYQALNYHHWHVCSDAIALGNKYGIPVYKFLKVPLIRKYGPTWYQNLEKAIHEEQKD